LPPNTAHPPGLASAPPASFAVVWPSEPPAGSTTCGADDGLAAGSPQPTLVRVAPGAPTLA
jgi:hypothetical protein